MSIKRGDTGGTGDGTLNTIDQIVAQVAAEIRLKSAEARIDANKAAESEAAALEYRNQTEQLKNQAAVSETMANQAATSALDSSVQADISRAAAETQAIEAAASAVDAEGFALQAADEANLALQYKNDAAQEADRAELEADRAEAVADELSSFLSGLVPRGHVAGLRVSNNATDPATAIDIAPGEAADSTATYLLQLEEALTKRLDATWAEGDGEGGLFSGSKTPETTYYLFLIRRDSDGAIDAGFDTDPNAANRPAGWSAYAPVWELAVHTDESGNLWQFVHNGDEAIIFPAGGSADSPENVVKDTRYVAPNPFPGREIACLAEVLIDGEWGESPYGDHSSSGSRVASGIHASLFSGSIVVQTGIHTLTYITRYSGDPFNLTGGTTNEAPARVKIWKVRGANQ